MQKLLMLVLPGLLSLVLLLAGCRSAATENEVSLGKEFTLSIGQAAIVKGEDLTIRFSSVDGDSRCPKGVVCIQAGDAKCAMQITRAGAVSTVTLVDKGGMEGYTTQAFDQYKLVFKLTPYPEAGKTTQPGDYRLYITVNK